MSLNRDALWANGEDESVTVNQRALIDKILARYSGEFTVFRELLQNSDDAQATEVEIHFRSKDLQPDAYQDPTSLPDLNKIMVDQWIFRNNGMAFRDEDWHRLKKIAEGNPDEEKIGAFGVGFYSLFSVTDEPFVKSATQWMGFYWKDNKDQLFARRGQLPDSTGQWTSFEMGLREESIIPPIYDLAKFLASSITFMRCLSQVSVYLDGKRLVHLSKSSPSAPSTESIPRGMRTTSPQGSMTVKEVKCAPLLIQAEVMKWILASAPVPQVKTQPTSTNSQAPFSSFFSRIIGRASTPQPPTPVELPKPLEDLTDLKRMNVELSIFSAEVNVRLDKKQTVDIQRSTKKNPPNRLKYELVYTGKKEYDASKLSDDNEQNIFQGLRADLDGSGSARIFIGHATAQTTGIGGHMAARFIPTVERESIDLVDKSVARWNQELLYVGGLLARVAYEQELSIIRKLWPDDIADAKDPALREALTQRALHVMQFFAFRKSTPLDKVAALMKEAFFVCGMNMEFSIMTTRGVHSLSVARLRDEVMLKFLPYLPVVPSVFETDPNAQLIIEALKHESLPPTKRLCPISPPDVTKQLNTHPLTEDQTVACLNWWLLSQDPRKHAYKQELLDNAVLVVPATGKGLERIINLSAIRTYLDGGRIPVDGPLPEHVLPLSVSKRISTSSLTSSFGWHELSLLQWIQFLKDPKGRASPEYDIEISAVWAEQVLNTLARNWPCVPGEMKGKIVVTMQDLRCIPTNSGLRVPGEVYFPGANVFQDLPVVTLPSGNIVKGPLERTLEGLGVRKDVELQILFNKMIKTNEWTISDLVKHLAARNLQPDEIARLQRTAAFPQEDHSATPKSQKRLASDLYEPLDIFRQLGLPVLDWGTKSKWRSSSAEAKLAFTLGLKRQPPIETLVQLCASPDEKIQQAAWQYLVDNVTTKYPGFDHVKFHQIAFIPAMNGTKKCLGVPPDVFTNPEWAAFGFLVAHPSVTKDACAKLQLNTNPSADKMVEFLRHHQPKDEAEAKTWFEIMSSHMREYGQAHFAKLNSVAMVPTKIEGSKELRWLPPNQCYFRRSTTTGSYSKLFAFVDFGPGANSFLAVCGTRQEPSPDEVARKLLQNPQQFYDMVNGSVNYLAELQRIAVGQHQLASDTLLRMKHSKFLLALRRTPRTTKPEKSGLDSSLDDDEWDTEYALKMPAEVVIADDINAHQLFGDKLFTAPQEDLLEAFYITLGSRKLSALVKEQCRFTAEIPNSKIAAETRSLVLERLPLFLHEHTHAKTKISFNRLNEKDHFIVKTFGKLTVTKSLNVGQTHMEHVQEASAFSSPYDGHSVKLFLAGNAQLDMYEVALALIKQLFVSPKTNDALLFMTILSTDLRALKRRGYNVERILRQQQAERQAAELARAKAAVEPPPPPPARPPSKQLVADSDTPSMPGDIFRPASGRVKDTFQNLRDKFGKTGFGGQGEGSHSTVESPKIQDATPPAPPVPSQTRPGPGTTKPTGASQSDIASNIDMAISACRPEKNHLLHNRQEMRVIKESLNEGYCDLSGHNGSLKKVATMQNVHVFLANSVQPHDVDAFLVTNRDSIARFVHIMTTLSKVYNLPLQNMHIFHEEEGTTIAFNRNGSIFLNLRYYISWHDEDVKQGNTNPALISWYFTLAHEIAHNLVQPHNSEHEFYLSAICEKHLMGLGNVLYNV